MTDIIKPHNAKEILTEALDTIRATFWISGEEFLFASPDEQEYDPHRDEYTLDWTDWQSVNKFILANLDDGDWDTKHYVNPDQGKAKVTGVCSIGALALANVTLYDEPLTRWDTISNRDFESWKAGAALAQTILESFDTLSGVDSHQIGMRIADWNDAEDRTREEVVEMFSKAMDSPLLTATEIWTIKYALCEEDPVRDLWVYYDSQEAAQAVLDGDSELGNWIRSCTYTKVAVVPFVHNSQKTLVGAQ